MEASKTSFNDWLIMLCLWAFFGLLGGAVHSYENTRHVTKRQMLASLLTSAFAGMVGGMLFQYWIKDPIFIGGIGAICGYFGQLSLILIRKHIEKRLGCRERNST